MLNMESFVKEVREAHFVFNAESQRSVDLMSACYFLV